MRRVRGWHVAIWISLILAGCRPAAARLSNDVPSCYAANQIAPAQGKTYDRLVYVLIDQTVGWNAQLERQIVDNVNQLLIPGAKFVIAEFSAYAQGRYLEVRRTGIIESPMPASQENNTPISKIGIFKACLHDQQRYAINLADQSIAHTMQASAESLDQSDIMAALKTISAAVRDDGAARKVVLLASDGLENSSVTSFYRAGTMRLINPAVELAKAENAALVGNFGGAKVYVIGGALMPPAKKGSLASRNGYRNPQQLRALSAFWQLYFTKSNARLMEFGEPALVIPVRY